MSCEDKHADTANKFCPECGQKLEHFDIDKLNEEFKKYYEDLNEQVKKFNEILYSKPSLSMPDVVAKYIKEKDIKQLMYYFNDKLHTKKQTMEELGITTDEDLCHFFSKYRDYYICYSQGITADNIKTRLEYVKRQSIYQINQNELMKKYNNKYSLNRILLDFQHNDKKDIDELKAFMADFIEKFS